MTDKTIFRTQLITTKGDVIRTFYSSSRPSTSAYSNMGNVEITYHDSETSFTIMGNFNVIVEKVEKEEVTSL